MKTFLQFLAARLREPSTVAAISVGAVLAGMPPGTVEPVAGCVAAVAGVVAALLPESR